MNEDTVKNTIKNMKCETKEDVVLLQEMLLQRKKQIIDEAPTLSLCIKDAPFYLDSLYKVDGTPKGDFNVSESQKRKVALALKHPSHKSSTGRSYWGHLSVDDEYKIQIMPTFFSNEELDYLELHNKIVKKINNVDVELVPLYIQKYNFSVRVKEYKEIVKPVRERLNKYDELLSLVEYLKTLLPSSPRIITIIPDDDVSLPR